MLSQSFILNMAGKSRRQFLAGIPAVLNASTSPQSTAAGNDSNEYVLWYRQPAPAWTHALPIGNGRLGAMVFADSIPNTCNSTKTPSGRALPATGIIRIQAPFSPIYVEVDIAWQNGRATEAGLRPSFTAERRVRLAQNHVRRVSLKAGSPYRLSFT